MTRVLLGVGSNLEPREEHIRSAVDLLQEEGRISSVVLSTLSETEPVGGPPQGAYLNGVLSAETELEPTELLRHVKAVERRVGRQPGGVRWGPREVDVDILLYGGRVIQEPGLTIPHARLAARRFVLEPASEIVGDWRHPILKKTIRDLLRALPDAGDGGPRVIHTVRDMRAWVKTGLRNRFTTGFVPTMGALHEGHVSLLQAAYHENDRVCASIFVNPKQFDEAGDLERYPRVMEEDLVLCAAAGVDAVFAPSPEEMYPRGFRTSVEVEGLSDILEGAARPGHFVGVSTVVCKLLAMILPDRAYFGQKDAQQVAVVRRMVRDLAIPCAVVEMPTVREPDGLALSSRNRFLEEEARRRAAAVPGALEAAVRAWKDGVRTAEDLVAAARSVLEEAGLVIDYVALVEPDEFTPLEGDVLQGHLVLAARVDEVRLLDNVRLE
ncbi:MAG: pantoate--beta-alanine ligase [Planctomycetota bacterium]